MLYQRKFSPAQEKLMRMLLMLATLTLMPVLPSDEPVAGNSVKVDGVISCVKIDDALRGAAATLTVIPTSTINRQGMRRGTHIAPEGCALVEGEFVITAVLYRAVMQTKERHYMEIRIVRAIATADHQRGADAYVNLVLERVITTHSI